MGARLVSARVGSAWRAALVWAGLLAQAPAWAGPAAIHWRVESHPAVVEVAGLGAADLAAWAGREPEDGAWRQILAVFAEQVGAVGGLPPMDGAWRVEGECLRFEPRFPLVRGVRYRAEYRPAGGSPLVSSFELPPDRAPPSTTVTQVFPSADELPENQLKFYVHFSGPMSRGGAYDQIQIRDAAGRVSELAFLELDEELWDPGMTRLTLLIDPGRIKRGVRPLEEVGPVFVAGQTYTLTIGAGCRDAAGRPLRSGFVKTIRVLPADRTPPDPARWKLIPPAAGTREPLRVEFDEPMDQALALRLIGVAAGRDGPGSCAGEASLGDQERRWQYAPDVPWSRGPHRLVVATTIEDLAGNNIGKAFDVDVFERVNRQTKTERITIPFDVR